MLQLVSRHVIEIQEIGFKKFGTELRRIVGLHQILAGNVIASLVPRSLRGAPLFMHARNDSLHFPYNLLRYVKGS